MREETKRKISNALKGRIPKNFEVIKGWNKGKKMSDDFRKKVSESHKGMKKPWAGKCKESEEHKRKISESNFRRYKNNPTLKKQIGDKMRGEKSYRWKGGVKRNLSNNKYKKWRLAVFIRDNFTCLNCGKVGGYLEAHHIKSWAKYPKLRYAINNGATLCRDCHDLTKRSMKN